MPEGGTVENLKEELARLQEKIQSLEGKKEKTQQSVKVLFRWQAFSRPYLTLNAKHIVYLLLLIALIILILAFIREFFIIAPVLALAFLGYSLAAVKPELIENSITTQGINSAGKSYIWEELHEFWFTVKDGFTTLHVDTFIQWPRRLLLLINKDDTDKVKEILARYLPYRELPKTSWLDHAGELLTKSFRKLAG